MKIVIRQPQDRVRDYECMDCNSRWCHYYKTRCPSCGSDNVYWVN